MRQWYVVYTKPRSEKKVADELNKLGIEAYCPTKKVVRQWSDRKKIVEIPLFSSYCFVYTNEAERRNVFEVNGVSQFVYWLGRPAIVREVEIEEIKRWLNDYVHEAIHVQSFEKNEEVIIRSGTWINHEGIVLSQKGNQLVLQLEGLGYRMSVSLAEVDIEKSTK